MKPIHIFALIMLGLIIVFVMGPQTDVSINNYSLAEVKVPEIKTLEQFIKDKESKVAGLKPGNEAQILWANDSLHQQTEYALVYLHGYSASKVEGKELYTALHQRYNCNIYLSRLAEHGIESEDAMLNINSQNYWYSAKEALVIGNKLGKKVILIGTSTGATLALLLAAHNPTAVHGLMLYSPNIDIADPTSEAIAHQWGLQIARLAFGGTHRSYEATNDIQKYWQTRYRLESLVFLKRFLKEHMVSKNFMKVTQPLMLQYYYKDEQNQDEIISVAAARQMFADVSTPDSLKWDVPQPNTQAHVITSAFYCKDLDAVLQKSFDFADNVLLLPKQIK